MANKHTNVGVATLERLTDERAPAFAGAGAGKVAPAKEATATPPPPLLAGAALAARGRVTGGSAYAILRRKTRTAKKNVVSVFVRENDHMRDISRDIADELVLPYEPTFKGVITKLSPEELVKEYARAVWGSTDWLRVQVL